MRSSALARVFTLTLLSVLALAPVAACGGDDDPNGPEPPTPAEPVDAAAFKDCILSGNVQRGVYEEVPNPSADFQQAADEMGAEFFEAGKADDGLVFFYVLNDPAAAEGLSGRLQDLIDQLASALADEAPAGVQLGDGTVEVDGPIVVGLLPFSEQKAAELNDEALADVSDCLAEV